MTANRVRLKGIVRIYATAADRSGGAHEAISSWAACHYASKEEAEAQDAVTMRTGIHNFLLYLSDHFFANWFGLGGGSFFIQSDGFLAVRALCHISSPIL